MAFLTKLLNFTRHYWYLYISMYTPKLMMIRNRQLVLFFASRERWTYLIYLISNISFFVNVNWRTFIVSCPELKDAFVQFSQRNLESIVSFEHWTISSPPTFPLDFNPFSMLSRSPVASIWLTTRGRCSSADPGFEFWLWMLSPAPPALKSPSNRWCFPVSHWPNRVLCWFSKSNYTFVHFNQVLCRVGDGMHLVVCIIYTGR